MSPTRFASVARRWIVAALAPLVLAVLPASAAAQQVPSPTLQEVLIKNSLIGFNDAVQTGNFDVFHSRLATPFRQQFTAEKLRQAFQSFFDQRIDIAPIAAREPVMSEEPVIDGRGALLLRGYFATKPSRVTFSLDYLMSDGAWKLISINVRVRPDE